MKIVTLLISVMLVLPILAFAQGGAKLVSICKGTTLRLKAESSGAFSYEWLKDGIIVPGESSSQIVASEAGNYSVFALNAAGCSSEISIVIQLSYHVPTAVDDQMSGKTNELLLLDVLKNDQSLCAELDTATINVNSTAAHGVIFKKEGKFLFKPERDFEGTDSFTYAVRDKSGQITNIATVTIDLSASPLPVQLISFNAVKKEMTSFLTWATSMEMNSDRFEIERSPDARSWNKLGEVLAVFESNTEHSYDFTDENPESGLNYYRLKMIDRDGTFAYSHIKSVYFPEFTWAKLFPNPVNDVLNVIFNNRRVRKIRLIDSFGRVVYDGKINSNTLKLAMKSYVHGVYFIHLEQDDGMVRVFKIMHE
ncbi:Ig-like domain-containing protein [Dyadobacter sp. CY345]|uniref:Ig-like domain-containing protein n=1 Tax=Dyadobacter sp. CY345 TaxID=2909335 RepID=UPI001F2C5685|nr:Ig-like domain-containing protein [Dyadobacter sp. CY345]MCF2442696.1 Ig-like domain-containing protein [Dyadobacter sp. CY345]